MAADAYRQVTYLNDTTYENTQVLVEYATNGSLGSTTTAYSFGVQRVGFVQTNSSAVAGFSIGALTYQTSGTYYYTGTGSVANVTGSATNQSYTYTADGIMTAFAMSASAGMTSDGITGILTTNPTAYGTYGVYSYNGEYTHTSLGLQYLRARYLNVATGTFMTKDTYAGRLQDILSQNRYTYAENNPVGHSDPSGHAVVKGGTRTRALQATANSIRSYEQTQRLATMTTSERAKSATKNSIQSYIKEQIRNSQTEVSVPNVGVGKDDIAALQWPESISARIEKAMCAAYDRCTNAVQEAIKARNMYNYINRDGIEIQREWPISNAEFRDPTALTQEEITNILEEHNPALNDMKLDIAIYEISWEKQINPKVILATLGQEQGWGTNGQLNKLFGVGPGGEPKSFNGEDMGGLEEAVDTYLNRYCDGREMEDEQGLADMLVNVDQAPYKETDAAVENLEDWQRQNEEYVEYMENGIMIQPVNSAMYARLKYTPWVDFPPQESTPLDDWVSIYNSLGGSDE